MSNIQFALIFVLFVVNTIVNLFALLINYSNMKWRHFK